ncbi:MAG: OsmC family protein [Phycisphaerales bacterium]|nr:OsmC family protein [Phycisphaerales bacterium]
MGTDITTVTLGQTDFRTEIAAGNHTFYVDEPGSLGGGDTAPDPYQLLLGSLGACKAITARMYAKRKGWALDEIRLDLRHSRPNGRGKEELIEISVSLTGDLSEEQRERLKEITNACPVSKTIEGDLKVVSSLED